MGLILDSSVLVAAERQGHNARQMLASLARKIDETEVGISVITLIELVHGAARADTPERRAKRQKFIEELLTAIPIHPVTVPLALRTGRIDGENQARGVRVPLPDLLIGVTALELGYSVGTANLRHFQQVPICPSCGSSHRKTVQQPASMLMAAKEETLYFSSNPSVFFPLAAFEGMGGIGENSRTDRLAATHGFGSERRDPSLTRMPCSSMG